MTSNRHSAGRLFLTVCFISFVCFLGSYMRIPIVPLFAASLGADTVQVGLINAAFMVMAGSLSIPAGLISDRFGRRIPLLGGLALLAGSSFLLYWSSSPLQMGAIYLFFGVGLSAFSPTLMSYVADITPPEVLGQAYGWYTMALYGGITLGPAAGSFLGTAFGLRSVFLVSGGLIFAMFFMALLYLPMKPADRHTAETSPAILPALKSLMGNHQLLACLIATIGGCVSFGMFITFMPLYIHSLGMTTGAVGLVFATQALANALSRLPSGKLCDRVKDRSILVIGGLTVFAMALVAFSICSSLWSLMADAALMGISMGTAFTVVCAMIVDVVPREMRGLAMGGYNTCVYTGMMLCSVVMGLVIKMYGYRIAFLLTGTTVFLTMILVRSLYRRNSVQQKQVGDESLETVSRGT